MPAPDGPRCARCSDLLIAERPQEKRLSRRFPHFPFCSERCRLVDLNGWFEERYVIPGPEQPTDPEAGI